MLKPKSHEDVRSSQKVTEIENEMLEKLSGETAKVEGQDRTFPQDFSASGGGKGGGGSGATIES